MNSFKSPASISARHIHLSALDRVTLFGEKPLEKLKDLSQPGEYATTATASLITSDGRIDNVRILGPDRAETQIEISATDARTLRLTPPLRLSGDLSNTPEITIKTDTAEIHTTGVIIAKRHLHINTAEAEKYGLHNGDTVSAHFPGPRGGVLNEITIRTKENYALDLHLDTDEANAVGVQSINTAEIIIPENL